MSDALTLPAELRERAGKGASRELRRNGRVPAVIYGDKQAPLTIAVEPKSIERELHKEGFFNHRLQIDVEGHRYRLELRFAPDLSQAAHDEEDSRRVVLTSAARAGARH